jgi:hypothetical protein
MLRLTFGGAPCPLEWGSIAESICDLANAILLSKDWDPLSLQLPAQHLVPNKITLEDDIPFRIGRDLIVDIPVDSRGIADLNINNICGLTVDIDNNATRLERAPLLALVSAAQEVAEIEPLSRDDIEARPKLIAEAGLTEIKPFLGWLIDFRRTTIALPDNKILAYSTAIEEMLKQGYTSKGELETNIGRWVHLGQIIPTVHHFLSRMRFLKQRAENRRQISINKQCKEDLLFSLFVLGKCNQGINLNLIAFRRPTHVYRSDSCLAGLGGYSHEGFTWRFYLPDNLQFRASNNLLEHLAAIITPWIDIIAGGLTKGDCALSMTDSTTSEGWLRKSNFIKDGEYPIQATIRIEVARLHATHYLSNEIREYSQWFRGADNNVADALSRDNDRTDDELTQILRSH